ncbi:enolase-phosphatase E1-like isoform X3 [Saccostrea echinata]|uniref:enolase-phosphatase E1-like isoform X3 n=1 Tax=Saccostrea echinata TaxID=191078 RepID=UPI002A836E1C|nr:enolase-phosphatase E1-like isoform X3 [Saccostrea echinata]
MEEGKSNLDIDTNGVSSENGHSSTYKMEIGIAKLDNSYLENHLQCARVVQNPMSQESLSGREDLFNLSSVGGTISPGYPNDEYEEIGNVQKGDNSSEDMERSRSLSSEDVFASGDFDDYLDPICSPKSVNNDDSGPGSLNTVNVNDPPMIIMTPTHEYEDLSPVSPQEVCTSYTSLTLKTPNQSTVSDSTDAKETNIYDNCDIYENDIHVPRITTIGHSNVSNRKEGKGNLVDIENSSDEKENVEKKSGGMNELANESEMDFLSDKIEDMQDNFSVRSIQGSVANLGDVSCDVFEESGNVDEIEDDIDDDSNSDNQGEFDFTSLEQQNEVEDELDRYVPMENVGGNFNASEKDEKVEAKFEDNLKDDCSVLSIQGSVSYLDDSVSYFTENVDQQLSGMNETINEFESDIIPNEAEDDIKDSCSMGSIQGSVDYLDDDISCDVVDESRIVDEMEDIEDDFDTTDSKNQGKINFSALEERNSQTQDEFNRYKYMRNNDEGLSTSELDNKSEDNLRDNCSVISVQGSVSYLYDNVSCFTDDLVSIGKSDSESDENITEPPKIKVIEEKQNYKKFSRDDDLVFSKSTTDSDLDQIPSNLVKRLSQQFSKSMGDLRYVPFSFSARKTSLPKIYKEEEKGPKGQKTTRTKEEETRVEESETGQKTTTTTKTTTVVQNGDISNGPQEVEEETKTRKPTVQEEIMSVEGGVYENEPVHEPGVVRESDPKNIGEELPEVGTAKSMLQRFTQIQEDSKKPVVGKRQATPPRGSGPVEYVSEPRAVIEKPEQKLEGGIFENQPVSEEGVVKSYDTVEDVKPEQGYARNVLAKFKEIETQVKNRPPPSPKKELTPDRFTKGEYVSEPRSTFQTYEGKTESGIFESQPKEDRDVVKSYEHEQEVLPEQGTARNLVSRFKEYESKSKSPSTPREKKELTPDRFTKGEYVSEPRATFEQYEGQVEAGIYESKPVECPEIVKSGEYYEEPLPEQGYAKNVISKFKDIQKGAGSPSSSPANKPREITPPRQDTFSGVLENKPQERSDIVHSYDVREEDMPETGTTRNLLNKFREIQHSGSNSPASPRLKKEFTPPPQSGIYENTPQKHLTVEQREAESGILENNPDRREGVAREEEPSAGTVEFPERGYAKNMVSKWKQLETEHSKSASPSPRYKEFTPPREEPRIKSPLSPKSPAGTNSSVHPRDLPGQYQEQGGPGIYENQPTHRADIAREDETDWSEGLPKEGTSKSLISKFRSVQEEAKKSQEVPKPISRRDSADSPRSPKKKMFEERSDSPERGENTPTSVGTPKSPFVAVQLEKCAACQKTVYAMEKIEMNKNCYHRACFKCSHCNSRLTAKTFSMNEGVMYCTNHFKQLFARKGNYDEGFGRQQHKKRWQGDQPNGEQQTVQEATA